MTSLIFFARNFEDEFVICESDYKQLTLETAMGWFQKKEIETFIRDNLVSLKDD